MKKNFIRIIILIAVIWLIFFIKDIPKYRFGYFVEGPELKYEHRDADVLKLENGNVLILGQNAHSCPTQEACKDNIMPVVEIPSEIYNAKTNKIEELRLPNNIRYQAKGILLKNNRLLLTYAYNPNDNSYPKVKELVETAKDTKSPYLYDSMAIVNLDTMKVERIIKKQINANNKPQQFFGENFILLSDNEILIIDFNNRLIETYDTKQKNTKSTRLFDIKIPISYTAVAISSNKNQIFIFDKNGSYETKKDEESNIYNFNDITENVHAIGNTICKISEVKKIDDQNILIVCSHIRPMKKIGNIGYTNSDKKPLIKIYNTNTQQIKNIARMPKYRCAYTIAPISNRYSLITGGHNCSHPFTRYYRNSLILDLDKNKVYNAVKLPYDVDKPSMITLDNGDVLVLDNKLNIYAKKTLLFKR